MPVLSPFIDLGAEGESDDESLAASASSDSMEVWSYGVLGRGHHTPQLKFASGETTITIMQPMDYKQIPELNYYPMTGERHGVALIINNKKFDRLRERTGTDRDESNLVQAWLYLGYRVEVRRNCTGKEIESIFKDIDGFLEASNEKAVDGETVESDSFVSCILSHGDRDEVFGSDSKGIKMEAIERSIGQSKTLHGKPKLFFVQTCRGGNPGAEVQADEGQKRVTNRSDMHFSYATTPGDKAWRDPVTGSWFVNELCKILCEFAPCCTLYEMQLKLNVAVPANGCYQVPAVYKSEGGEYTQQPSNAGTMTRCVHFFDSHQVNGQPQAPPSTTT